MTEVAAIILAAGLSRRMGRQNKLLLPVGGVRMIHHVVAQYRMALDGPITVVTGHDAPLVDNVLADMKVECVFNLQYAQGQQKSVAFGLMHCPEVDAVLIGLGDQPLLRPADIIALLDVHRGESEKIAIPTYGNIRGNPIVVPRTLRRHLTVDPSRPGCMRFTRENPDLVHRHTLPANGFYTDIDTQSAYALFNQMEANFA